MSVRRGQHDAARRAADTIACEATQPHAGTHAVGGAAAAAHTHRVWARARRHTRSGGYLRPRKRTRHQWAEGWGHNGPRGGEIWMGRPGRASCRATHGGAARMPGADAATRTLVQGARAASCLRVCCAHAELMHATVAATATAGTTVTIARTVTAEGIAAAAAATSRAPARTRTPCRSC